MNKLRAALVALTMTIALIWAGPAATASAPTVADSATRIAASLSANVAPVVQQVNPGCVYSGGGWLCGGALPPNGVATQRLSGETRYHTAVEISKAAFPNGADVVYIASGGNFPDALAGGFAFAGSGPVLLVPPNGYDVPTVVADEVTRLKPKLVVALGGSDVVSDDQLEIIRTVAGW